MVLETTNNRPPTPFSDFVSQSLWEKSMWDQRIAYKLMWEKFILGNKSKKYEWLNKLPSSFGTPFHWGVSDLANLQYPALETKVKLQKDSWKELYEVWHRDTSSGKNEIDFSRFVWSLEAVNSRAFSGVYEGSNSSDRRSILLFTGLLTGRINKAFF